MQRKSLGLASGFLWSAALSLLLGWTSTGRGETLPLDPKGSSVTFTGESFLHNFHGEAAGCTGEAEFTLDAAPPIQRAVLRFKTAAITTFHRERDQKMRDWMNIKVHPDASFQLESVKLLNGDYKLASATQPAVFAVAGTLTLNGVKQALAGTARGWREKDRVIVAGDIAVDTLKHGLPQIREAALLTVGTSVKTAFRFAFVLPPEYAAK